MATFDDPTRVAMIVHPVRVRMFAPVERLGVAAAERGDATRSCPRHGVIAVLARLACTAR
jgi:hypothetical protein